MHPDRMKEVGKEVDMSRSKVLKMTPVTKCFGYLDPEPFYPKDTGLSEQTFYFRSLKTDDPKITEIFCGIPFTTTIACSLFYHPPTTEGSEDSLGCIGDEVDMEPPLDKSKPVIIVCHGYNSWSNQAFIVNLAASLAKKCNCHTLRFDFTGNGHSTGDWSGSNYDGELNDLRSVDDFVQNHLGLKVAAIVGHSKGSITVNRYLLEENLKAKEDNKPSSIPCGVSLAGLFMTPDTPDQAIIEWFRISKEHQEELDKKGSFRYPKDENAYPNDKSLPDHVGNRRKSIFKKEDLEARVDMNCVKDIDSWILTIYGGNDNIVPKDSAVKYASVPPNNEQHTVEGANHDFNGTRYMKEITATISEFITKHGGL